MTITPSANSVSANRYLHRHLLLPRNNARSEPIRRLFKAVDDNNRFVTVSNVDFFNISPAPDDAPLRTALNDLYQVDLLVLVSVNAINQLVNKINDLGWQLPNVPIAVMGQTSAKACQAHGLSVQYLPKNGNDSEALLRQLAKDDWQHKHIMIMRAQDGRDFLANALEENGAKVDVVPLYRRMENDKAIPYIQQILQQQPLTHILLSSISTAQILSQAIKAGELNLDVNKIQWLCFSQRIAAFWQSKLNCVESTIKVLENTSDKAIYTEVMHDSGD